MERAIRGNRIKKRSSKSKLEVLENVCNPLQRSLLPHQVFLSQFMNPATPYEKLLIFHGTGTGKTCVGIRIAEQFKDQVSKYNTKIYLLVKGPGIKQRFIEELQGT